MCEERLEWLDWKGETKERKKKNVENFGGDFISWNKIGTLDLGKTLKWST